MNTTRWLYRFFLLLLACVPIAALAAPPEIEQFYTDQERLARGETVTFTVEGTPRGRATVRIDGISRIIPLKESERGVYEGRYTVRDNDRLTASNTVRASLRVRGVTTTETLTLPWGRTAEPKAQAPAPAAAAQPPVAQAAAPAITRFAVTPIARIEPGADLAFSLAGTPGATASFTIDGVVKDVRMQERSSGQYGGSYTIRRMDHFPATVGIVATLEANGRAVRSSLSQALITDAKPPVIRNVNPRDGETVLGGAATSVSAIFDDSGGVGIDPKSVRLMLGGADVTRNATITAQSVTLRTDLRPGAYPAEVSASDLSGNSLRHVWKFSVAAQAAPASLPLEILSHAQNAQVGGGPIQVRGRTAPAANVEAKVTGIASIAGMFGVNQPLYGQTLHADANGDFAFSFQPQLVIPGARYEISLRATKAELTTDLSVVLFQKN